MAGHGTPLDGARPLPALIALVLGAIDTILAIVWMAGTAGPGSRDVLAGQ
jgi:hypothetical protein